MCFKKNDGYEEGRGMYATPKPSRWKNELWKTVAPDRGREERYEMIEYHTMFCNGDPNSGGFPWFILLISSWQIGYFVWMYYTADPAVDWNSWNSQFNDNIFMFSPVKATKGNEWWRFFTYCFVHAGWEHLLGNMLIQIMLGIILEIAHGTWRITLLYTTGVVVGSVTSLIVTPHTNLVGASGGDFCLITAVIANCMLNGDSMNCAMAILRVSLMTVYCGMEVYFSIQRYMNHENSVSWAAHLGGAVTGLLLGTMVLRNLNKKPCERVITILFALLFAGYIAGCISAWMLIIQPNDIESVLDIRNTSQLLNAAGDLIDSE